MPSYLRVALAAATTAAVALTLAACSSSGSSSGGKHSGAVDVLSAGSLLTVVQKGLTPGLKSSTGYTLVNFSAGSSDLAADIKGKVKQGDVFISASPKTNATLEGAANGNWVSWYAKFATSELVLGYNPHSKFAADLRSKPWYDVLTESGIRVGLTPPASDPKGVLAVQALTQTGSAQHLPALASIGTKTTNQFPETTLAAEVAAGQLDVGFFYQAEANAANLPTVPLSGVDLKAVYTVTVLHNAPHEAAAEAFVAYLLSPSGVAELKKYGFDQVSPVAVTGTGVPASLHSVVP